MHEPTDAPLEGAALWEQYQKRRLYWKGQGGSRRTWGRRALKDLGFKSYKQLLEQCGRKRALTDRAPEGEFSGKPKTTPAADVGWVASHLIYNPEDIDVAEVPSASAWALLLWARTNKDTFYRTMYAKLLPKEGELQRQAELEADDGRMETLLEDLLRMAEEAEREDATSAEGAES